MLILNLKEKIKSIPILFIFLLGSIIYAIGAGTRAGVPGIIFDTIRREFHFTASQTSGIASFGVFGCLIFIGISGFLIDRYGWKKLILFGIFLQIVGEWFLYTYTTIFPIYLGAFINGGGRTIGYLCLLKILDLEFDRRFFSILIGFFYIFSYGGTFLGSSPFEYALSSYSWQTILQWCNILTFLCSIGIGFFLFLCKSSTNNIQSDQNLKIEFSSFSWKTMFTQMKKKQCLAVFYCTASGIVIYWSIIAVMGKKYLEDVCQTDGTILGVMNIIVMIEMIFSGTISFFLGNRRKIFQIFEAIFLLLGSTMLFLGTFFHFQSAINYAWIGFLMLGVGYGFTVINITACREFVSPIFTASAIGFVNFCANIAIIIVTQFAGNLFDYFSTNSFCVSAMGYQILLVIYILIAFISLLAACYLRDSRGHNISAEI